MMSGNNIGPQDCQFEFYEDISNNIESITQQVGRFLESKGALCKYQQLNRLKSHLHASVNTFILDQVSEPSTSEGNKENLQRLANIRRSLDFNEVEYASTRVPTSKNITVRPTLFSEINEVSYRCTLKIHIYSETREA